MFESLLMYMLIGGEDYFIGPIIGASIGADAVGIFSWGKSCERFTV